MIYDPQLQYNPIDTDASGKAVLKDEFKQKNPDNYFAELLKQMGLAQSQASDQVSQKSAAALNNANSNLSMRGGLNTANRANLARANMRDSIMAQQGVASTGLTNAAGIGVDQAKANVGVDQNNLNTLLTAAGGVNTFNLEKYKQQMAGQAAEKQADATRAAGDGGKK